MPTFEQQLATRRAELDRAMAGAPAEQPTATCGCGRPVRLLNYASGEAKCTGCGYAEELCRCAPLTTERSDRT